ncbi:hypothetical protein DL96DRAFT_218152 [Flagelloscypha sp. PMI_526]|nr:hypothetical protein DL96DRAFT_218152 [Flagelloscypha sp. PMI_526]
MGGFNSLPPELQHEVLFSCDSETLVACCQSAQCLLEVSRAVLYHSIRLDDDKATRLVANALKHAHHIRHLHAVTTDDSAYEGSWITLFTALKTAGVLESLNTIPPTTEWSRWSPKMIAALDDLSELTSIRSFKANSPRGAWTWASLARWGARLKGLRLLDNYIPFSEDQEIRAINPHLHTLHIEQLCEPSAYPCSIRFVRCLSLLLDRNGVWSEKEESIYQANLQTAAEFLDILSISWHWDQGKGPTLRGFNTPLPSLRTLALLYSNKGFMGPSKSYIQQISSVAPLILHLKIFISGVHGMLQRGHAKLVVQYTSGMKQKISFVRFPQLKPSICGLTIVRNI